MFGNGSMFSDEQLYDGKVFLRSYADSLKCIKQAAEASEVSNRNEIMMNKIIKTKEQDKSGTTLKNMKEYKLLQFTNFIFKKYLPEFDSFQGEYPEFKEIIENGLKKMLDEINPQSQPQ